MHIVRPPWHPRQGRRCVTRADLVERVEAHRRNNKQTDDGPVLLGPVLDYVLSVAARDWMGWADDLAADETEMEGGE